MRGKDGVGSGAGASSDDPMSSQHGWGCHGTSQIRSRHTKGMVSALLGDDAGGQLQSSCRHGLRDIQCLTIYISTSAEEDHSAKHLGYNQNKQT